MIAPRMPVWPASAPWAQARVVGRTSCQRRTGLSARMRKVESLDANIARDVVAVGGNTVAILSRRAKALRGVCDAGTHQSLPTSVCLAFFSPREPPLTRRRHGCVRC
jgi:hypothetical protein